jgi:catechol 2,3-dioxygenase-like lactoylglutathione lyase family enzyme
MRSRAMAFSAGLLLLGAVACKEPSNREPEAAPQAATARGAKDQQTGQRSGSAGPKSSERPSKAPRGAPKRERQDPASLLGGERGLDHVGLAVRELDEARKVYSEQLGFGGAEQGRLPNGLRNANFYFRDATYLELLTVYDPKLNPWVAGFIDRYESGAIFLVLCAYAYAQTKAFLATSGYPVGKPLEGRIRAAGLEKKWGKGPMWHTFYFADRSPLPGDPKQLFFIAYDRRLRRVVLSTVDKARKTNQAFRHPNTAVGLRSVWIAVPELAQAAKGLKAIGLAPSRELELAQLDAVGREFEAGRGHIVLLQPKSHDTGPLATFLARRSGIVGVTIAVADLSKARAVVQRGLGQKLPGDAGPYGPSFVIPPRFTKGLWLELSARP